MKNTFLKTVLAVATLVFVVGCSDEDEFTGDSTMSPTNPSLSVTLDFPSSNSLIETDATYNFTVNLSAPTIAAVDVKIAQTGGTATDGLDFEIPHSIRIPAGATSASGTITIFEDDIAEDTENAIITIGSGFEANVSATNAQTVSFNIMNYTTGDLAIGLDWATASTITDNFGGEIGAYDAADLRLLLTAGPNVDTVLDGADGATAETYVLDGAAPDGEYYLVTDFYVASDIPVDLDITLTFDQAGIINGQTHNFSAGLNTSDFCADLHLVLAKVIKTGTSYAFEEIGEKSKVDYSPFVGTWSGNGSWFEIFGYTSEVVTTLDADGGLWVNGVAFQWFEGWWGEVIISNTPVKVTSYDPCTGDFVIAEQPYVVTTYLGDEQDPYGMSATGTISADGTTTIFATFHQGGGSFNGTSFGGPPFLETITLD